MTAVMTAHNGNGSCKNCASARAIRAANVTLMDSAHCTRCRRARARTPLQSVLMRFTLTIPGQRLRKQWLNVFRGDEKTTSTAGWKALCAGQSVARAPQLLGRMRRHHLRRASLSLPEPADKMAQPIEIDIDHRRGVE